MAGEVGIVGIVRPPPPSKKKMMPGAQEPGWRWHEYALELTAPRGYDAIQQGARRWFIEAAIGTRQVN